VGLALADHGKMIVIADSNRFDADGASSGLAVVAAHSPHLVGYLTAGDFPRDMAVSPDGAMVLITDFGSGDVQEVDVANVP
jgi:DNA-binding beta-propeller fold protein YncE